MKNLKILLGCGLALFCGATAFAQDQDKAITPTACIELFNGRNFTGWQFATKGDGDPRAPWSVADGVIKCTGKPNGYIRTQQAYRDYKVTVEWRFTKAGNTGLLVHMHLPDKVWPLCIECQGQHDKQGDFWLQGGARCKDRDGTTRAQRYLPLRSPSREMPVGEWNTMEAVCAGNIIKLYVNGTLMNEADECSISSGFIGLQSEGGELEIRDIFVEPASSMTFSTKAENATVSMDNLPIGETVPPGITEKEYYHNPAAWHIEKPYSFAFVGAKGSTLEFRLHHAEQIDHAFWGVSLEGNVFTPDFVGFDYLDHGEWEKYPLWYCGTLAQTFLLKANQDYLVRLVLPSDLLGKEKVRISISTGCGLRFVSDPFSPPGNFFLKN